MLILAVSVRMGVFCLGVSPSGMAPSQEIFVVVKGTPLTWAML